MFLSEIANSIGGFQCIFLFVGQLGEEIDACQRLHTINCYSLLFQRCIAIIVGEKETYGCGAFA